MLITKKKTRQLFFKKGNWQNIFLKNNLEGLHQIMKISTPLFQRNLTVQKVPNYKGEGVIRRK